MDAAHWHQGLGLMKPMEEMMMSGNPNHNANPSPLPAPPSAPDAHRAPAAPAGGAGAAIGAGAEAGTERKARPQKEKAINCPRCNSTTTKFCYYNNYSLQQPRYFCKTCRRYWTEGGSLRNVPVGGGSRKNKRSSSSVVSPTVAAAAVSTSGTASGSVPVGLAAKNPKLMHEGAHDLNLSFPHHHGGGLQSSEFGAFPSLESSSVCNPGVAMVAANGAGGRGMSAFSAMELLRSTGCYVPMPQVHLGMPPEYAAAGFALSEFRMPLHHQQQQQEQHHQQQQQQQQHHQQQQQHHQQQQQHHQQQQQQVQNMLGFSLDTHGTGGGGGPGGYGACSAGLQGTQESASGRLLFPFEDLKAGVSAPAGASGGGADQFEHSKDQGGGGGGGGHETLGFWNSSMIGNGNSNVDGGGGDGSGSW